MAEDGQLALSNLAASAAHGFMPKIQTQGQLGQARWRLVSAPSIPGVQDLLRPLKTKTFQCTDRACMPYLPVLNIGWTLMRALSILLHIGSVWMPPVQPHKSLFSCCAAAASLVLMQ